MATGARYLSERDVNTSATALLRWWESLDDFRGERARLRRAETPQDVLLTDAFAHFLHFVPPEWCDDRNLLTSALVASVLAHVRRHDPAKLFAQQLALPREGGTRAAMSELRFQQLQKSRDPEEFYRRLLRAVRLLREKVNIISLAKDIVAWMYEYQWGVDRYPAKRLAVRWASDYYTTLKSSPTA